MTEFFESVKNFLDQRCILNRDEIFCAQCGTRIRYSSVGLTIREDGWQGMSEEDEVWSVALPYCPSCEPAPKGRGYLHSTSGLRPN